VGSLAEWISAFRELHEKARRGSLGFGEQATYRSARDELEHALLAAQRLTLKPGEKPRQALRVARALQIDIEIRAGRHRSVTLDVSVGGFSTHMPVAPELGEDMGIALRLPASGTLTCRARVTDARQKGKHVRVAARFLELPDADRDRLEMFVLDTVLAQLAG
jgi:hypothetical protein